MVGQSEVVREGPVVAEFSVIVISDGDVSQTCCDSLGDRGEHVVLAPIIGFNHGSTRMRQIWGPGRVQPMWMYPTSGPVGERYIHWNRLGARVRPEVVVETVILFHHDYHALDGRPTRYQVWQRRGRLPARLEQVVQGDN